MGDMERIDKLESEFKRTHDRFEKEIRTTQDSVLLIHKDLQQMNQAMTKMANSVEILANVQTNQKVMEERCETRHNQIKDNLQLLHTRIDKVEIKDAEVANKADKGASAYTFMLWAGGIIGSLMIASAFGIWLWAIAMKGVTNG